MEAEEALTTSFQDLGIDQRILKGIQKVGWSEPTLVQSSSIPFALQGKDVLIHAKTGTGKTACYAVPVIQSVLTSRNSNATAAKGVCALVLVPTKELSRQVKGVFESLCKYCEGITVVELSAGAETAAEQRSLLRDVPHIVIATPARVASRIDDKSLNASTVQCVVIDEADLVLGYGYADDVKKVLAAVPASRQTLLLSATLSGDVDKLKKQALNRPVSVKLEDEEGIDLGDDDDLLHQLSLEAPVPSDKFLIFFVMLKLRLIHGKTLVFVNDIKQAFRLKLLLESFYIAAHVLNSELPQNSRAYVLESFDKGAFSLLIATDERDVIVRNEPEAGAAEEQKANAEKKEGEGNNQQEQEQQQQQQQQQDGEGGGEAKDEDEEGADAKKGKKKKRANRFRDLEYGVTRGCDFKRVRNVINFDLPRTPEDYVHRIGRTARAGARGNAISFICNEREKNILEEAAALMRKDGGEVKPFAFKMHAVEGFRYRVENVLNAITKNRVKHARVAELKQELLRSEALKNHFEEHPDDLELVKRGNRTPRVRKPELKAVPDYLMPTALDKAMMKTVLGPAAKGGERPSKKHKGGGGGGGGGQGRGGKRGRKKRNDPLKSFKAGRKRR